MVNSYVPAEGAKYSASIDTVANDNVATAQPEIPAGWHLEGNNLVPPLPDDYGKRFFGYPDSHILFYGQRAYDQEYTGRRDDCGRPIMKWVDAGVDLSAIDGVEKLFACDDLPLYRNEELWASRVKPSEHGLGGNAPIVITIGELDCDNVLELLGDDFRCTTWPGGRGDLVENVQWESKLPGGHIIILPRRGEGAVYAARHIALKLIELERSVSIVPVYRLPGGGFWSTDGVGREELLKTICSADPVECEFDVDKALLLLTDNSGYSISPPDPLHEEIASPVFPVEVFPDKLQRLAMTAADAVEVPVEFMTCTMLGIVAGAIDRHAEIQRNDSHVEPLSLYLAVFADTGERKSAAMKVLSPAVTKYHKAAAATWEVDKAEEQDRLNFEVKRRENLKRKATKDPKLVEEYMDASRAVRELEARIGTRPADPLLTNATGEGLAPFLMVPGRNEDCLVLDCEGRMLEIMMGGAYSKELPDLELLVKCFSREPWVSSRAGKESANQGRLEAPVMSMVQVVQPVLLDSMFANERNVEKGACSRFLMSFPASKVGTRFGEGGEIPKSLLEHWSDLYADLASTVPADGCFKIPVCAEAWAVWRDVRNDWERALHPGSGHPFLGNKYWEACANRVAGNMLRIAGALHAMEHSKEYPHVKISQGTMENARRLMDYFMISVEQISACVTDGAAACDAKKLLGIAYRSAGPSRGRTARIAADGRSIEWVENLLPDSRVTRRDMWEGGGSNLGKDRFWAAVDLLVKKHWLIEEDKEDRGKSWILNPYRDKKE